MPELCYPSPQDKGESRSAFTRSETTSTPRVPTLKSGETKGCWCHIETGEGEMQTEVQEFTVRDRLGELTLRGIMLADARYGRSDRPRWTDMALYQVTDPASEFRYVLEIVARSFVYHRFGGSCVRAGHRINTVADVRESEHRWKWLVPCRRCKPPELEAMRLSDRIAEEKDKHQLYMCTDAEDILTRLYREKGEISELAAKLLIEATGRDPELEMAWRETRRI